MKTFEPARVDVRAIFQSGLQAVDGRRRTAAFLRNHPPAGEACLVAVGKAAAAMAGGAAEALGGRLKHALVISKPGHIDNHLAGDPRFTCLEAAHPVPDQRSLDAGDVLIRFLRNTPAEVELLFLISGGASSLVEVSPTGMTLAVLQEVNRWLLGSGLPIGEINRIRQAFSGIKGGRLAAFLGGRTARVLLISDVAGDDAAIIGSGLLYRNESASVNRAGLPGWLEALLDRFGTASDIDPNRSQPVAHYVIARLGEALAAAAAHARILGYPATIVSERLAGEAGTAGRQIVEDLSLRPPGLYLWGGEPTVRLPARPGRGGRCQSLALAAALAMRRGEPLVLLAAGTDGTDGPGDAAGAVVDPETVSRGTARGLNAQRCLENADAGTFLAASDDLVITGPTGTNVTDIVLALKPCIRIPVSERADRIRWNKRTR
jgi:glycerate 2-kinase